MTESGTEHGSVRLYALPQNEETRTSWSPEDRFHTCFYLPDLKSEHSVILSAHSGPFSRSDSALAPASRILLLFVTISHAGRVIDELAYVVRANVFEENLPHTQHLQTFPPAFKSQSVQKITWTDWGPTNSRLLPYIATSVVSVRYVLPLCYLSSREANEGA